MAEKYDDNDPHDDENAMLTAYEELRTTLKTPENPLTEANLLKSGNFDIDDYTNITHSSSGTSSIADIDNILRLSENSHEVLFDHHEWEICDPSSNRKRPPRQSEFLQLLLENSRYSSYVSWVDKSQGLFRILRPERVADLWRKVKCRQTQGKMSYETFARGVRYYYGTGLMIKTNKKYTFCFKQSTQ
ncbi:unnamed protein product [Rotaria magnacalcarata]|uniref:ETS domain-containing protein n=1 Tax=Rotaria magnacalcarata TaxID=392030 RepID=A0A820F1F9_9BILA|nr:unnamed protein product [Rotaria magnacalcarata]CAF1638405.1 unnamed protein product [Rotaria magnacalcarata]CAF1940189.1 unnamed protein product [Rotaria magnacalcarata]CAF2061334.1 unnamed protein product [Rotaria magnacalcarata]CAF2080644.1 unnamed protein product [Rotaria magnacalcarata]